MSGAPKIKLTYFDMRGRAEAIRLAFAIGKIPFEDDRFPYDSWMKVKPTTPFGSVPVMTVDGKQVCQSLSMLRYAGKLSGLYPVDSFTSLCVDEVMDTVNDLHTGLFRKRGAGKAEVEADRAKFVAEDVPRYWGGLEKRLEVIGKGPFVLGDTVTIADIAIAVMVITIKAGIIDHIDTTVLDGYPRIAKSYKAFMAIPEVAEWYKKHPVPNANLDM